MNRRSRKKGKVKKKVPTLKVKVATSKSDIKKVEPEEDKEGQHGTLDEICLCKVHDCRRSTPKLLVKALEQTLQTDAIRRESRVLSLPAGSERTLSLANLRISLASGELKPPVPLKKVQMRSHSEPPGHKRKSSGRSSKRESDTEIQAKEQVSIESKRMKTAPPTLRAVKVRKQGASKRTRRVSKQFSSKAIRPKAINVKQRKASFVNILSLITKMTKKCYGCNSSARYYKGGFFCKKCKTKFETTVNEAATVFCSNNGKCVHKQNCTFCLTETFYIHGVKAADVNGFEKRYQYTSSAARVSSEHLELSEEEVAFCKYLNKFTNTVLDWLWNQGDLLKLTPNDRTLLLEKNIARARLIWIVAEMVPRHNVIKVENGYLSFENFPSDVIRRASIEITDMALFISSFCTTPQHLYFMKLLSIFEIGKAVEESSQKKISYSEEDEFERCEEIKMFAENYKKVMHEMLVSEEDMWLMISMFKVMKIVSDSLSSEDWIEDVTFSLKQWTTLHPDWEKAMKEMLPPSLQTYPADRHTLCHFLNVKCVQILHDVKDLLSSHFSNRDQKELLRYNYLRLLIISMCWKSEYTYGEKEEDTDDKFIKIFYSDLRKIEKLLQKEFFKYCNLSDIQLLMVTRSDSGIKLKLSDCGIKAIDNYVKNALISKIENQVNKDFLMKNQRWEQMVKVKEGIQQMIDDVGKVSNILISWKDELPLFMNTEAWITESH